VAAQFFMANMNDPAKEGTVAQYDGTIEQLKELHQTMFPLFKLQQKLLAALGRDPTQSSSEKGKGRTLTNKDRSDTGTGPGQEGDGGNEEAIEYMDDSLKHAWALDKKLRNRLEVLYIALKYDWKRGKQAERMQRAGEGSSIYDKILKEEEDDRRRKRDKSEGGSPKRQKFASSSKPDYRGRGGYGSAGFYSGQGSKGPMDQAAWNMLSTMATNMASTVASNMLAQGMGGTKTGQPMPGPSRFGVSGGTQASAGAFGFPRRGSNFTTPDGIKKCFLWEEPGHIASFCPNRK
jgi:hypothetical protein